RDQDKGYIEGYSQGAAAVSVVAAPAMETFGASLLQGALARAHGGAVDILSDANGQATGYRIETPVQNNWREVDVSVNLNSKVLDVEPEPVQSFGWDNAVSRTDGDFGYLNQNPRFDEFALEGQARQKQLLIDNTGYNISGAGAELKY